VLGVLSAGVLWCSPLHAEPSKLPPSFAYNYGESETARSAAMGGALHALGSSVTAPFLNPANMGLTRVYHLQAQGQVMPEAGKQLYGGTIVDSSRRLSGGVSFVGGSVDPDGLDRNIVDARIAVAFAVTRRVHLGFTGRYLNLTQEGLGPLGTSRASGGLLDPDNQPSGREALVNDVSFDAGLTVLVGGGVHIAGFGHNLSYPDHGFLPTVVGGGVGYGGQNLSIEVDGVANLTSYSKPSPRVMAGAEYLIGGRVPLALGYRLDLLEPDLLSPSHQLSAGVGYVNRRVSARLAVRRSVAGPSATGIYLSLAYHLESTGTVHIQPY
jgi:hypothetical protein